MHPVSLFSGGGQIKHFVACLIWVFLIHLKYVLLVIELMTGYF